MTVENLISELKKRDPKSSVYIYKFPTSEYADEKLLITEVEDAYDNTGKCVILDIIK